MKRLFFALWPDQAIRQQCAGIITDISENLMRPTAANNLHVTLLFLGSVAADKAAAIEENAAKLCLPPFSLTFTQLSYWPKPDILCLTSNLSCHKITTLSEKLAIIASENDVSVDKRPLQPHITLGRKIKQPVLLRKVAPITWQAEDFCLVESLNSHYSVINRWKLAHIDL